MPKKKSKTAIKTPTYPRTSRKGPQPTQIDNVPVPPPNMHLVMRGKSR